MNTPKTDKKKNFILLGKNISYSLSDKIHNFIYKSLKQEDKYEYKIIDTDCIEDYINSKDIEGGNLTTPYKEYEGFDKNYFFYPSFYDNKLDLNKSLYPCSIKSHNTFFKKQDKLCSCSTDMIGCFRSLLDSKIDINKIDNILVLGSGGMLEAIIEYFIEYNRFIERIGSKNIYVFSRRKCCDINESLDCSNLNIKHYFLDCESFDEFIKDCNKNNSKEDILCINALLSSVDISFLFPGFKRVEEVFNKRYFMDLNYSYKNSILSKNKDFFEGEGFLFKDGLEMLVYQAMYSECIWLQEYSDRIIGLKEKILDFLSNF